MLEKPLLRCLLCGGEFSERDVRRLRYFGSTGICRSCYRQGVKKPYGEWCFGKKTIVLGGKRFFGYSEVSRACQSECPDRKICHAFVQGVLS